MATVTESVTRVLCPTCGHIVDYKTIQRRGISPAQVQIMDRCIRDGRYGHVLYLVDSILKNTEPGKFGPALETQMKLGALAEGQSDIKTVIAELAKKLSVAKTKGDVAEEFTTRDLKSMFPYDEFSEDKAAKKGADVVATVRENGRSWGTIVISVKSQEKWSKEFLTQTRKNMGQENTSHGLQVTAKFPRDALNDKGYDASNKPGEILWVAKPEYETFAYGCLRYALIATQKAKAVLKGEEERIQAQEQIAKVVKEWINGEGLQKTLHRTEEAIQHNKTILDGIVSIESGIVRQVSGLKTELAEQMNDLVTVEEAVKDLKKCLEGKGIGVGQK